MELHHFDTVRGAPVDAMHNVYLGLAKELFWAFFNSHIVEVQSPACEAYHKYLMARSASDAPLDEAEATWLKQYAEKVEAIHQAKPKKTAHPKKADTLLVMTLPPLISELDQKQHLQVSMDACASSMPPGTDHLPRKVGSKAASFTAAEWASWATTFAVPHFMEIIRTKRSTRLSMKHIQMLIDLKCIVQYIQAYHFSPKDVLDLEKRVLGLMVSVEQHFGANAIKPNHHIANHLGAMVMDLGPPAGWSCFGYERWNRLVRDVPMNPAKPELSMMKRAQSLLACTQLVAMRQVIRAPSELVDHEAADINPLEVARRDRCDAGRPQPEDYARISRMLVGNAAEDVAANTVATVSSRVTSHGRRTYNTSFADGDQLQEYLLRDPMRSLGWEPYAGCLLGKGKPCSLADYATDAAHLYKKFIKPDVLRNCLSSYYGLLYGTGVDGPGGGDPRSTGLYSLLQQASNTTDRTILAKMTDVMLRRIVEHPLPLDDNITVYDQLLINGCVVGSGGEGGKNSRVWSWWRYGAEWKPAYASVNFFFTHRFQTAELVADRWTPVFREFTFACVDWYDKALGAGAAARKELEVFHKAADTELTMHNQWNDKPSVWYPYLRSMLTDARSNTIYHTVPVKQIAGRWIACQRTEQLIQALPIPQDHKQHA
jgi:hypothetical protein